MNYVVTGATGHLGRLVVESLLSRGVPADQITATGRDLGRIEDLAAGGVRVLAADFDDPASLQAAFAGADKVLLVSGSEIGRRLPQHRNAIAAAADAGVGLVAYTSIAHADTAALKLAEEHLATEKELAGSGVPHVVLRNSWYLENYLGQLTTFLAHGAIAGSAGEGRVSAATRADYAEAAAAVLLADDQAGKVYELGGDDAFTLAELADVVSQAAGRPVTYQDLPAAAYVDVLVGAGLPAPYAEVLADSDLGLARGELEVTTGDLSRLIGRPTTSVVDAVRAGLAEVTV
jgi:NAD(P)H dehydrogenase (quinone)